MTDRSAEQRLPVFTHQKALEMSGELLRRTLVQSPKTVREYTAHLAGARGKGIRAAALLACAMDENGLVGRDAVSLAAAVELVHLATLVHDDVIDDAPTRRGIVTLQKKYGKRTAVICGDYLLCLALKTASGVRAEESEALDVLVRDMSGVCLGELRQHVNRNNLSLSVYRYLQIIAGKTAALFEAAYVGGALLSGADAATVNRYRKLGRLTGLIFQLRDDLIDYELTEQIARKPVRSDYEQGVITLPLIAAMRANPDLRRRLEAGTLRGEALAKAVRQSGGVDFTLNLAERYRKKAARLLTELPCGEAKLACLTELLDTAFAGPRRKRAAGV